MNYHVAILKYENLPLRTLGAIVTSCVLSAYGVWGVKAGFKSLGGSFTHIYT